MDLAPRGIPPGSFHSFLSSTSRRSLPLNAPCAGKLGCFVARTLMVCSPCPNITHPFNLCSLTGLGHPHYRIRQLLVLQRRDNLPSNLRIDWMEGDLKSDPQSPEWRKHTPVSCVISFSSSRILTLLKIVGYRTQQDTFHADTDYPIPLIAP